MAPDIPALQLLGKEVWICLRLGEGKEGVTRGGYGKRGEGNFKSGDATAGCGF